MGRMNAVVRTAMTSARQAGAVTLRNPAPIVRGCSASSGTSPPYHTPTTFLKNIYILISFLYTVYQKQHNVPLAWVQRSSSSTLESLKQPRREDRAGVLICVLEVSQWASASRLVSFTWTKQKPKQQQLRFMLPVNLGRFLQSSQVVPRPSLSTCSFDIFLWVLVSATVKRVVTQCDATRVWKQILASSVMSNVCQGSQQHFFVTTYYITLRALTWPKHWLQYGSIDVIRFSVEIISAECYNYRSIQGTLSL